MKQTRQDRLALFDLDLTLIDSAYQLTDERINEVAQRAIESGWTLGLSSDTPRDGMEYWRRKLGFNGPLVVEKGAAIVCEGESVPAIDGVERLGSLRDSLAMPLARVCDRLWTGDAPGAIRDGARVGEGGEEIVLLNTLRDFSFSLYGGVVASQGTFRPDRVVLDRAVSVLHELVPGVTDLDQDVNHDYGIVILHDKRTSKRLGSLQLMRNLGLVSFVMVGNSMTDYVGNDIAQHYAVANATKEFRTIADTTVDASLTEGCIEVLDILCKQR